MSDAFGATQLLIGSIAFLVAGCALPVGPGSVCRGGNCQGAAVAAAPSTVPTSTTPEAANRDRINRFLRLASGGGADAPRVDTLLAAAGNLPDSADPVPVVHVVFPERAFFDFDNDQPRPDSDPVLQAVAETMRQDVPMTVMTVLGHTDAVGSTEYNVELSKRRAGAVMQALIGGRVDPAQLSTVAIGKAQPIASNRTEAGRALNRRVEFLISSSLAANLDVIRRQPVDATLLSPEDRVASRGVAVYQPDAETGLRPLDELVLRAPVASPAARATPAAAPVRRKPDSVPAPTLNTPEKYRRRELSPDTTY